MQCKTENSGNGEAACLKEGRRVTRCARSVVEDINKSCLEEFRKHWQCLDNNNHQLWQCRPAEWKLNKCVYENLVGVWNCFYAVLFTRLVKLLVSNAR